MSSAGATMVAVPRPFLDELIDHTGWIQLWLPFITAMIVLHSLFPKGSIPLR